MAAKRLEKFLFTKDKFVIEGYQGWTPDGFYTQIMEPVRRLYEETSLDGALEEFTIDLLTYGSINNEQLHSSAYAQFRRAKENLLTNPIEPRHQYFKITMQPYVYLGEDEIGCVVFEGAESLKSMAQLEAWADRMKDGLSN